jgi:murein DD-endopeptidase MepM/ murein hydrolase activator NlpD
LDNIELLKLYNEAKEILDDKVFCIDDEHTVIDRFGFYIDPFINEIHFCEYIFVRTQNNTKLFSITAGEVIDAGYSIEMGNYIIIMYDDFEITYGNLSIIGVNIGDTIFMGQIIGYGGGYQGRAGSFYGIKIKIRYKNTLLNPNLILNYNDSIVREWK